MRPVLRILLSLLVVFAAESVRGQSVEPPRCTLGVRVVDEATGSPLPARLSLQSANGLWHDFVAGEQACRAVVYRKQNWINANSVENHTTVSAHRCQAIVPAGEYRLTVHHGKDFFPVEKNVDVTQTGLEMTVSLKRWANPAAKGWFSGDTHLHRTIDELRTIILAEDLNVALPLTNWVTVSDRPPLAGDKNLEEIPRDLVKVDSTHVIWPRNTEYEIFRVSGERHTLGALFVLGHRQGLQQTVPPWKPVVQSVLQTDPDALFDMDKLDWPFSMLLPTVAPGALYELSNNHVWQTEFAFREWNTEAPPEIQPPFGATEGGHRQWIDYTMGMYYALLNCGFRLPPSAGTANGVHPVPAGFGRVYVQLEDGFNYDDWMSGLKAGRSFVTTGPMMYATVEGEHPGYVFSMDRPGALKLSAEIRSAKPLAYGELLVNGRPQTLVRAENRRTETGAYESTVELSAPVERSGWIALRFWQPGEDGQSRFVHSAPWYVELNGQPVHPWPWEKRYLVKRIEDEMRRSRDRVGDDGMAEYERAHAFYRRLETHDLGPEVAAVSRRSDARTLDAWLDNMIVQHRFDEDEVRLATGLTGEQARDAIEHRRNAKPESGFAVLPYPGGRHPRIGFLEGAVRPQRETKISVFPPWEGGGYVVVDVPEAVFASGKLIYLAHTHIPTVWDEQNVSLPETEWLQQDSRLTMRRELPDSTVITATVDPIDGAVRMQLELTNGTDQTLTGARVQVCTMLKGAVGFNTQEKRQSVTRGSMIALRSENGDRWIITEWEPNHRVWTNPPVPCFHSDPVFPDCPPGKTVSVQGGLWFYQGTEIEEEMERLHLRFIE